MISTEYALSVLLGKDNILWRSETKYEALRLLKTLYKSNNGVQDKICTTVLEGPPQVILNEYNDNDRSDRLIFEIFSFLESEQLPLTPAAQQKLIGIRNIHPKWMLAKYPGMSHWHESGSVSKSTTVDDVISLKPEDIPSSIINFQTDWFRDIRYHSEAIGVAIGQNPKWGIAVLNALQDHIQGIPEDGINPILWGIRATLSDNTNKFDTDAVITLLQIIAQLIDKKPSPLMWSSLPSVLKDLVIKFNTSISIWNNIGIRLEILFRDFDYERTEEKKPIEWIQRAINHPYGDLTYLYLELAKQHVNALLKVEKPPELELHCEIFFEKIIGHYGLGSRYGRCLLAERLSWMEAISHKFSQKMLPMFDWNVEDESTIVAWSGYLWSRALSRSLEENSQTSYLLTAKRHKNFSHSELNGLTSHLAAVLWFQPDRINLLIQISEVVDSEIRIALLRDLKFHLSQAQAENAEKFFRNTLMPYWDWCSRQIFFTGEAGDKERFTFWELLPHSYTSFPEASHKAIKFKPSKCNLLHLFVEAFVSEETLKYPNELVELLIVLLELDQNPFWQREEWGKAWKMVKNTNAKRLSDFLNMLARKNISIEEIT